MLLPPGKDRRRITLAATVAHVQTIELRWLCLDLDSPLQRAQCCIIFRQQVAATAALQLWVVAQEEPKQRTTVVHKPLRQSALDPFAQATLRQMVQRPPTPGHS